MSVLALLLSMAATPASAQDAPPVVHERRLDEVGVAGTADGAGTARLAVRHRTLPSGSFAEVTALDTGRTVVALVERDQALPPSMIVLLSAPALDALGIRGGAAPSVRIRPAAPSPAEQASVRTGGVVTRLDAPPALLTALRRRSPQAVVPAPPPAVAAVPSRRPPAAVPPAPLPRAAPAKAPVRPASGRWFVQVAALSDAARAAGLAKSVDGVVRSAGRLYRVQAGPFATRAAAETARAAIARRGFGDARIIAQD